MNEFAPPSNAYYTQHRSLRPPSNNSSTIDYRTQHHLKDPYDSQPNLLKPNNQQYSSFTQIHQHPLAAAADVMTSSTRNGNLQSDQIKIYVTLKRDENEDIDRRKLILMTNTNIKISMLKRLVEQEYADLFPNDSTFICAKLQDEYGYSLSNSSYIFELVKNGDRLFAIPEAIGGDMGIAHMHLTSDVQELLYLLRSIQQNICVKMTDGDYNRIENLEEVLAAILPLGFCTNSKQVLHNVGTTLRRIFLTERLQIFEVQENQIVLNLLVNLLHFWVCELIFSDTYLLQQVVDILEILFKSLVISGKMKSPQAINSLMLASKLDNVSAQTRSRLIKLISHLTRGQFSNSYHPKPIQAGSYSIHLDKHADAPVKQAKTRLSQQEDTRHMKAIQAGAPPQGQSKQNLDSLDQFYASNSMKMRPNSRTLNPQAQPLRPSSNRGGAESQTSIREMRIDDQNPYSKNQNNNYYTEQLHLNIRPPSSTHVLTADHNAVQMKAVGNQVPSSQQVFSPQISSPQIASANLASYNNNQNSNYAGGIYAKGGVDSQQADAFSTVNDNLMKDYVSLIDPTASRDMHVFAVQNLDPILPNIIHIIMDNAESYSKILNLIEITLPGDPQLLQMRILDTVSKHLNPPRAEEGLKQKVVQRVLKAFNFQPASFQPILFNLMRKHLEIGGYQVDIPIVIALIESPYDNLQNLGMKIFTVLSDPNRSRVANYDVQFENHIKMLLDLTLAREKTHEFVNHTLLTISNISLKDSLRPHLIHNKGIEILLAHLRNQSNVEGSRIAAKALLNLSISSRDTKMRIVGELTDEVRLMHKNELDQIVHGYLQTLLMSKDNNRDLPLF